jgi:hypothetical protein
MLPLITVTLTLGNELRFAKLGYRRDVRELQ